MPTLRRHSAEIDLVNELFCLGVLIDMVESIRVGAKIRGSLR